MDAAPVENRELKQPPRSNVLAVEDVPSLRSMLDLVFNGIHPSARKLDRFEMCETPQQVLERLQTADDIDALMMDYSMPEMNGAELARKAREHNPRIVTILTSSKTREDLSDEENALFDLVIGKRFSYQEIPDIAKQIKDKIAQKAA